jgi:hypothetical protein
VPPGLQVEIQTLPSGVRGIVATSNLPDGHIVVELPASCTAFSAQARLRVAAYTVPHCPCPPCATAVAFVIKRFVLIRLAVSQSIRDSEVELGVSAAVAKYEGLSCRPANSVMKSTTSNMPGYCAHVHAFQRDMQRS